MSLIESGCRFPIIARIQQKLIEIAAERAGVPASEVTPATNFVNELEFDSLDVTEFVMEVEDEFKLRLPDEEVEKLATVGLVINFVVEQLKVAAASAS